MNKSVDVLVVGAGMVGAAAAIGFARQGYQVCVLDAADIKSGGVAYSPSFDERSTALSYGSRIILEDLGVWSDLSAHVTPIKKVHVSEKGRLGVTRLNASDYRLDALGYVAPNQAIGASLLERLTDLNVDLMCPQTVASLSAVPNGYQITLNEPERVITARLLIIADGAGSQTACKLGIDQDVRPYEQYALITNVEVAETHSNTAYERFTQEGPLALLPLSDQRMALVWTVPEAQISEIESFDDARFLAVLKDKFGGRLGGFTKVGKRFSYPLKLSRAKEQFRPGLMLLGNAAHSLHPVAGQGFNLALRGVASLLAANAKSEQLGDAATLSAAYHEHMSDQRLTITASDQLVKRFSNDYLWLSLSRDLGLIGLNNLPVLKRLFAEQAMGLGTKRFELSGS